MSFIPKKCDEMYTNHMQLFDLEVECCHPQYFQVPKLLVPDDRHSYVEQDKPKQEVPQPGQFFQFLEICLRIIV